MKTDTIETIEGAIYRCDERARYGQLPWNMGAKGVPCEMKLAVLTEEVGEVAKACQQRYKGTPDGNLKLELIDVIVGAVMWLESLESEE